MQCRDPKIKTNKSNTDIECYYKFLSETTEGKYAEVEESSIPYSRLTDMITDSETEDNFIYSLS